MDNSIILTIYQIVVLLASVIIHEVSHGLMALKLGDDTAERAGRLTLNPVSHIDPFGSILLPLLLKLGGSPIIIGWAKPVPYNPHALYKDFIYGPLKVALAGPFANIFLALIFGIIGRLGEGFLSPIALGLIGFIVIINSFLAFFNLLPIPPLDGTKILTTFLPPRYADALENIGFAGTFILILFIYYLGGIIAYPALFTSYLFAGNGVLDATSQIFGL